MARNGGNGMEETTKNPRCGNSADANGNSEVVISVDGESVAQAVLSTIRDNHEA